MSDFDDELESGFTVPIPQNSVASSIEFANKKDDEDIPPYLLSLHNQILEYEYEKLRTRYKSYDLIKIEEECRGYHKYLSDKEGNEGKELANSLKVPLGPQSQCQKALQVEAQKYLQNLDEKKRIPGNVIFNWPLYDDELQRQALALLCQSVNSENYINFRAIVFGYLECVCRISAADQSQQARVFSRDMAWAIGRHPYGSYFTLHVIGIKSILQRFTLQVMDTRDLCEKVKEIVFVTADVWVRR